MFRLHVHHTGDGGHQQFIILFSSSKSCVLIWYC